MFKSAALKLTVWYLAIIMVVSIIFSLALYSVSSTDLDENIHRQVSYFNGFLSPYDLNNYSFIRQQQLDQDREHLKARLVSLNLAVLIFGGLASYGLARRTLEPIEEALESQKRFTADASHELRTPLTAMQTETEVTLRNPKITKTEALEQLHSNLEEVGKLKSLSEGLLKLASADAQIKLEQTVDLSEVLAEAKERLAKAASAKRINVELRPKKALATGDKQAMTDIAAVLLDNAIKYSPAGSKVTMTTGKIKKQSFLKVSDHGQGIDPSDLPHIFDRFYRADVSRTKNKVSGYGLGLALARKLAEQHGGHIEVKSTVGQGSTFSVYFPEKPS